jgi:predicted CXXCH cytochrome family protein
MNRFLAWVCLLLLPAGAAGGIATTKHNLSVSGPGSVKASEESQICIFCHTPHGASPVAPLWNRRDPGKSYIPYSSSTVQASPGQPTGASILCLSCHDGTIALGEVLSREAPISMAGGVVNMPQGRANLGTDLSDDHPISFHYTSSLGGLDGGLLPPAALTGPVKLDASGQLQCTACHDPHDDAKGKFLVLSPAYGELCLACHDMRLRDSPHGSAPNRWDGVGADPWPETDLDSVGANACLNCHTSHAAGGPRLLRSGVAADTCLGCHNGHVADSDIAQVVDKLFAHPVRDYAGDHDPTEELVVKDRHVACSDCHNPHVAATRLGSEDDGMLPQVAGVTITGGEVDPIDHEYELCLRCHGDSHGKAPPYVYRLDGEDNVRREFSPSNPSYHPVAAPGRNPFVPSLIPPLSTASIITCTDCHNNDGAGPRGPHGSNNRAMLELEYVTDDPNPESPTAYALCYKCHDRNSVLGDQSFSLHSRHINGAGAGAGGQSLNTPCSVCHDPHGVNDLGQHSGERLINFDVDVVQPNNDGELFFQSRGLHAGTCSLRCHGRQHRDCGYDEGYVPGAGGDCSG